MNHGFVTFLMVLGCCYQLLTTTTALRTPESAPRVTKEDEILSEIVGDLAVAAEDAVNVDVEDGMDVAGGDGVLEPAGLRRRLRRWRDKLRNSIKRNNFKACYPRCPEPPRRDFF